MIQRFLSHFKSKILYPLVYYLLKYIIIINIMIHYYKLDELYKIIYLFNLYPNPKKSLNFIISIIYKQ